MNAADYTISGGAYVLARDLRNLACLIEQGTVIVLAVDTTSSVAVEQPSTDTLVLTTSMLPHQQDA